MAKHEIKQCPRCLADFECKTGSIDLCQCQGVVLDDAQLNYIAELYDDCLCATCLEALRMEFNVAGYKQSLARILSKR